MATKSAAARLRQDYLRIKKDPVPYVIGAEPLPSNILEWHYVIKGPEKTLYEGGYYHGKLIFPKDFPFKPPKIIILTPNGRFKTHTRLCLSISDFHPDTWNPAWSVATILTGLLSFMLEKAPTLGSIETSDFQKRQFAENSMEVNLKDQTFCDLFPDIKDEILQRLKSKEEVNTDIGDNDSSLNESNEMAADNGFLNSSIFANFCVLIGFALFAIIVNFVFKTVNSEENNELK